MEVGWKFAYIAQICIVTQEETRQVVIPGSEGSLVSRILAWQAWSPGLLLPVSYNGRLAVATYHLSTQVVEAGRGRLAIHSYPWLHSKSMVSLGCIIPCLKLKLRGPAE